jgi:pimeloyl-ACP methyl ester carboxylesterase
MTLVGHSWGAVLAWLYAAAYPDHVARLILVGCPPLAASYALAIDATRRSRMSDAKSAEYDRAVAVLADASAPDKTDAARRLGVLLAGVDDFAPLPVDARAFDSVDTTGLAFGAIWPEVARMREDGDLLALAPHIRCPVVAIHGDHDPHPADGVEVPLIGTVPDVRFHLLARCGHTPWRERYASEAFYRVLRTELAHLKKGERL